MRVGVAAGAIVLLALPAAAAQRQFGPRAGSEAGLIGTRERDAQADADAADFLKRANPSSHDSGEFMSYGEPPEYLGQSSFGGEPGCGCDDVGCDDCGRGVDCGCAVFDASCGYAGDCGSGCGGGGGMLSAGVELTFLKPHYNDNSAFTVMNSDGANFNTYTNTQFNSDLKLSPRVWLEANVGANWGWRTTYWQFNHSPDSASASPAANGFGEVSTPTFPGIDVSTTIPTDVLSASSGLNVYTIDVEALQHSRLSNWQLDVGYGVRYASSKQNYLSQVRTDAGVLRDQVDYSQQIEGFGPTMSLGAKRPLFGGFRLIGGARGSLLFGNGQSRMVAGEDLDLATPFTTTRTSDRDDLLPIGQARVGVEWLSDSRGVFRWMFSSAMEGQIWGNAGNASSTTGNLGFFGYTAGMGLGW